MKLKCRNFLRFLEGTSVIALETVALETMASEMTDLPLPLLRSCLHRSGQWQARSQWLSLSCANYVVLNAIASRDRIGDFRYTHASDYQFISDQLSVTSDQLSVTSDQ